MSHSSTSQAGDSILFLGSGGARFMVASQILASGGAWLNLNGNEMLLDPGPGSLVHSIRRKLQPRRLAAILLSHRHLDHSGDINVMIEAMAEGGRRKRGAIFVPSDALGSEPVVYSYIRSYVERIELLSAGKTYEIGGVRLETPVRHVHPVETYGFIFQTPQREFSWIADTRAFPGLAGSYRGELAVINVVRRSPGAPIDHLSPRS
ncbi:MAG: MBL fold metallo-hydrolase [Chloroflexota bacterium]